MKHGPSLEDERRALLEHIHSTRAAYRRMLTETDEAEHGHNESRLHMRTPDPAFPRSMTVRWVMRHPYAIVGGVAVAALLAPRAVRMVTRLRYMTMRGPLAAGTAGTAGNPFFARSAAAAPAAPAYGRTDTAGMPGASQTRGYDAAGRPVTYGPNYGPTYGPTYGQSGGYVKPGLGPRMLALGRTAATGLATAAAMVARDPARRQIAMRIFTIASAYLAKRRADKKEVQDARAAGVPIRKS